MFAHSGEWPFDWMREANTCIAPSPSYAIEQEGDGEGDGECDGALTTWRTANFAFPTNTQQTGATDKHEAGTRCAAHGSSVNENPACDQEMQVECEQDSGSLGSPLEGELKERVDAPLPSSCPMALWL